MRADRPKQYLPLAESTVLEQTLNRLISHPQISNIALVISSDDDVFQKMEIAKASWLTIITGGSERCDSVLNGLKQVEVDWVLVHDAARPCVRHKDISNLLTLASGDIGGILARQATDTMKLAVEQNNNTSTTFDTPYIEHSVPRQKLWHALTPQFFPRIQLIEALQWCAKNNHTVTDEASAIEITGGRAILVPGEIDNIKVTHPSDLALAEFYLAQQLKEQLHSKNGGHT